MADIFSDKVSRRAVLKVSGAGLALIASGGLAAACSSGTSKSTQSGKSISGSITVADIADDTDKPSVAAENAVVSGFRSKQPNLTVATKLQPSGSDEVAAFIASKTAPTTFVIGANDVGPMIKAGQLPDVTSIIKAWDHYSELSPSLLANWSGPNGKLYGVPQYSGATGLVISKSLFKSAGLDALDWQKGGKTFKDFRAAAKALSDKNPGVAGFQPTFKGPRQGGVALLTFMYSNGQLAETQDPGGAKWTATVNARPAVEALQLLQQMRWVDNSVGSNAMIPYLDGFKQLAAGKAAMCLSAFDGPGQVASLGAAKPDDFIMVPFPINDSAKGMLIGSGSGYVFSATATQSQLQGAFDYIVYENLDPAGVAAYYKAWSDAGKADGSNEAPQTVPFATLLLKAGSSLRQQIEAAVKPYVPNYSLSLYGDYFTTTGKLRLEAEPVVQGKAIKTALQTAVEVIMSDSKASAQAELDKANAVIQKALGS